MAAKKKVGGLLAAGSFLKRQDGAKWTNMESKGHQKETQNIPNEIQNVQNEIKMKPKPTANRQNAINKDKKTMFRKRLVHGYLAGQIDAQTHPKPMPKQVSTNIMNIIKQHFLDV